MDIPILDCFDLVVMYVNKNYMPIVMYNEGCCSNYRLIICGITSVDMF